MLWSRKLGIGLPRITVTSRSVKPVFVRVVCGYLPWSWTDNSHVDQQTARTKLLHRKTSTKPSYYILHNFLHIHLYLKVHVLELWGERVDRPNVQEGHRHWERAVSTWFGLPHMSRGVCEETHFVGKRNDSCNTCFMRIAFILHVESCKYIWKDHLVVSFTMPNNWRLQL